MYHILADSKSGAGLCGAEMCGLELWRLQAGRPTKRLTQEKPADVSLCPQCEGLSLARFAPADN